MVYLNTGLIELKNLIFGRAAGIPSEIILGEDGTAALETDTAMGSAVGSTSKEFTTKTDTEFTITMTHTLGLLEGNGFSYREVGLVTPTGGTTTTDTVTFTRNAFPVAAKDDTIQMQTTIIIELDNEV